MFFNSFPYIFLFLPIAVAGYFYFARMQFFLAKLWLLLASFFFYGYHNPRHIPLLLASMVFTYFVAQAVSRLREGRAAGDETRARRLVAGGIAIHVGFLGYFKYHGFVLKNINAAFDAGLAVPDVILPLAISFFTFQQIAYLVDAGRGRAKPESFVDYCLFVTFFPHLIAGPILRAEQFMPQLAAERKQLDYDNWAKGLYVFSLGLVKRVVIADTIGAWANLGFGAPSLSASEAWVTSLAYTLQIYFDFSGYTDMAIGSAYFFNIRLPANFNSPYQAVSIQDFWRRWHMTLSAFLRDYIYIPLGGNRTGELRAGLNILLTFLLGGLWHGANWTFVAWGAMHGLGTVAYRLWQGSGRRLPRPAAIAVTFLYINITWVFFRAADLGQAMRVLKSMFGLSAEGSFDAFDLIDSYDRALSLLVAAGALLALVMAKNTGAIAETPAFGRRAALCCGALLWLALLFLNSNPPTGFLYYDF